jgi:hypothetical protein
MSAFPPKAFAGAILMSALCQLLLAFNMGEPIPNPILGGLAET